MLSRGKFLKIVLFLCNWLKLSTDTWMRKASSLRAKLALHKYSIGTRQNGSIAFSDVSFCFPLVLHYTVHSNGRGGVEEPPQWLKALGMSLIHITRQAVPWVSVTSVLRGIGERRIAGLPAQHPSPQTSALGTSHRMTEEDPNTILWPFYVYIYPTTRIYIHIDTQMKQWPPRD